MCGVEKVFRATSSRRSVWRGSAVALLGLLRRVAPSTPLAMSVLRKWSKVDIDTLAIPSNPIGFGHKASSSLPSACLLCQVHCCF